jgi:hypothetical protein
MGEAEIEVVTIALMGWVQSFEDAEGQAPVEAGEEQRDPT